MNKPNILWLTAEQLNPHYLGFDGEGYAREHGVTNNLDSLAKDSVFFENAYTSAPLCVPTRISMWTGKYPHNCSAWDNFSILDSGRMTLARYLSDHGYETANIGKLHVKGPNWMGGFDHRPYGDLGTGPPPFHQPDPPDTYEHWSDHDGRFPYAGETDIPESLLLDNVATEEALSYIFEQQAHNPDKPWFLNIGYHRAHHPLTAPGRYISKHMSQMPEMPAKPEGYPEEIHPYDKFIVEDFHLTEFSDKALRKALASYFASIDRLDDLIGKLLTKLQKEGLLDNTVLIFHSDHGDMAGEHGLWWKRTYYDGSARIPILISGSGLESGKKVKTPVELVDLFPTVCDISEVPIPDYIDGESLLPLCKKDGNGRTNETARTELLGGKMETRFRMIRSSNLKYIEFPEHSPIFFHMKKDPDETNNLIGLDQKVPAEYSKEVDNLKEKVKAGLSWNDIDSMVKRDKERWKGMFAKAERISGAAQYRLDDGRIVDADRFLYQSGP